MRPLATCVWLVLSIVVLTLSAQSQTVSIAAPDVCLGIQTTLTGSINPPDSTITSWDWDLDGDGQFDDASGQSTGYLFPDDGTFDVEVRVSYSSGSPDFGTESVTVHPLPQVNFKTENLCEGQEGIYNSSSTIALGSISFFEWDFDNDGIADETGENVTYTCGPAQTYETKLSCLSDQGCEAFALKTTTVYSVPEVDFTAERLCAEQAALFDNNTTIDNDDIALYIWTFGDGMSEDSEDDILHEYSSPGDYSVNLTAVSDNGCRDSASKAITIEPLPDVNIVFPDGEAIYGDAGVAVTIDVTDVERVEWSNGEMTIEALIIEPGTYGADVYFTSGCVRSLEFVVTEETVGGIEVLSDIITPNGDGQNDQFIVKNIIGGENCEIVIVDRWNRVVFESNDYQNDWDGADLETGAYFYKITCDSREPEIGNINILK